MISTRLRRTPYAAALFLIALLCALMPLPAFAAQNVALCLTILGAGFCFFILKHNFDESIRSGGLTIPVLLAAFWLNALRSVLTSDIPFISFIYFCFFSALPLSFLWTLTGLRASAVRAIVTGGLGAVFLILSCASLYQYAALPDPVANGGVRLPFANPNSLAAFLSLGFFGSFGLMLGSRDRRRGIFFLILCALIFAALLTTGSRGAATALIAALIFFAFQARALLKTHRACLGLLAAFCGLALAIFEMLNPSIGATTLQSAAQILHGDHSYFQLTRALWIATWHIIQAHPLAGTGIGTFFLYYPEVRQPADLTTAGLMAHSDPLQFWAEMGVLAPLLFYALALAGLIRTVAALKTCGADDASRLSILVPACALAAMMLHSHITFNFYALPNLMLAGFYLGIWFEACRAPPGEGRISAPLSNDARQGVKGLSIALTAAGVFMFCAFMTSQALMEDARRAYNRGDLETLARRIDQSSAAAMGWNAEPFTLGASLSYTLSQAAPGMARDLQAQGLDHLARARHLNPRDPDIFILMGKIEAARGQNEAAMQDFERALALDPARLQTRRDYAVYLMNNRKNAAALSILREGLPWVPLTRNPAGFLNLTIKTAVEEGDLETHKAAMRAISRVILNYRDKAPQKR